MMEAALSCGMCLAWIGPEADFGLGTNSGLDQLAGCVGEHMHEALLTWQSEWLSVGSSGDGWDDKS